MDMQTAISGYRMTSREVAEQAALLVAQSDRMADPNKVFFVVLHPGQSQVLAEAVEAASFMVLGDSPESREKAWEEFHYTEQSFTILALSYEPLPHLLEMGEPAISGWYPIGALRVLPASHSMSLNDLERYWETAPKNALAPYNVEWTSMWDIATLAVDPRTRGKHSWFLIEGGLRHCLHHLVFKNHIRWLVGILTSEKFFKLNRTGLGLQPLAPAQEYLGVVSQPFLMEVDKLSESMTNSKYADILMKGIGFGEIFDLPPEINPSV